MTEQLKEINERLERLEVIVSLFLISEILNGDPELSKIIKNIMNDFPDGYIDNLWNKNRSKFSLNDSKQAYVEILNERIKNLEKLFGDLKNSTTEIAKKGN